MGRTRYALCVTVIALVVGSPIAVGVTEYALYSGRPFEAERWRAGDARQRARMVGDLNRSGLLIDRTWAEVVALLGPGDQEYPGRLLEYELVRGGLLETFEWRERFWIRFDPDTGRVREVTFFD